MFASRALLPATVAVAMSMALAACHKSEEPTAAATTEAADNGPDAKPGIAASDGRLVLPPVAGRPGVVYFRVRNDNPAKVSLAGVYVEGVGKTEMHQTQGGKMSSVSSLDIAPGQQLDFAPGGYHVMAFDIGDSLKAGGSTEMTLTFSDGDKLSMPIQIDAMGNDAGPGDMPGMDH